MNDGTADAASVTRRWSTRPSARFSVITLWYSFTKCAGLEARFVFQFELSIVDATDARRTGRAADDDCGHFWDRAFVGAVYSAACGEQPFWKSRFKGFCANFVFANFVHRSFSTPT
jgi:hypothetical protein